MRLKLGAFYCNMQITIAIGDYKSDQIRGKKRNDERKQNKRGLFMYSCNFLSRSRFIILCFYIE